MKFNFRLLQCLLCCEDRTYIQQGNAPIFDRTMDIRNESEMKLFDVLSAVGIKIT